MDGHSAFSCARVSRLLCLVCRVHQPCLASSGAHDFCFAIIQYDILGMGHSGELARSASMTSPSKDSSGNTSYELGKPFYTKEVDQELKFLTQVVNEKFLTPLPPVWAGVPTQKQVLAVACGAYHLLVSARNVGEFPTSLYTSGLNQYGQLGHGDTLNRHELTAVCFRGELIQNAVSIMCESSTHRTLYSELFLSWSRSKRWKGKILSK